MIIHDELVVLFAWLIREIAGPIIKSIRNRMGGFDYVFSSRTFFKKNLLPEFDIQEIPFYPQEEDVKNIISMRVVFRGVFYNNTSSQITLRDLCIDFYGPDGIRITHGNPYISFGDKSGHLIQSIAPKSYCDVFISTQISPEDLKTLYKNVVPVLQGTTFKGERLYFPLTPGELWGPPGVRWNKRKKRVVTPQQSRLWYSAK